MTSHQKNRLSIWVAVTLWAALWFFMTATVVWNYAYGETTIIADTDANSGYFTETTDRNDTDAQGAIADGDSLYVTHRVSPVDARRAVLEFDMTGLHRMTDIDSAQVKVVFGTRKSLDGTEADEVRMYLGTNMAAGEIAVGWYNDFVGWASSGSYTDHMDSDAGFAATYSYCDTVTFSITDAWADSLEDRIGGYSRIYFAASGNAEELSDDYAWQYTFEEDSPYMIVYYHYNPPDVRGSMLWNQGEQFLWKSGEQVPLWNY